MLITIRNIASSCISLFCILPAISFGQVKPLASGDIITRTTLVAEQVGNNPITFVSKRSVNLEVLIEENGDRKFLESKASNTSVYYANDGVFTDIIWHDKRIPQNRRFVRFPQSKELQPGMHWEVPPYEIKVSCGDMTVKYAATSEIGPDVLVTIDKSNTKIKTIRINYESFMPTCRDGWTYPWRRTHEILYSPELNELIRTEKLDWSARGNRTFLADGNDSGGGWAITAIQTSGKKEPQ